MKTKSEPRSSGSSWLKIKWFCGAGWRHQPRNIGSIVFCEDRGCSAQLRETASGNCQRDGDLAGREFQFTGLRPGKAFIDLKADNESLNGLSILRIERNSGEVKQGIEIKPGEEIIDLRIMIGDGTGVIRGQVKVEDGTLPPGARMVASISTQLRFANGYAQVDGEGRFVISGLSAGTYEITLNIYRRPPRQAVRLIPTLKQIVKVSDANESVIAFTVKLPAKE